MIENPKTIYEEVWDYPQAENLTNLLIRVFEANPKTQHIKIKNFPGVYSHEENWILRDYKLAVYYQQPYDWDDLIISWVKLTQKISGTEEKIILRLDCVYNTHHQKMKVSFPR